MGPVALAVLVGAVVLLVARRRSLAHFVAGVRTAIAFGSDPRGLFDRARADGLSTLPFVPMLGNRSHLIIDPVTIAELHSLPLSKAGVYESQWMTEYNIFGLSRKWLESFSTFMAVTKAVHVGLKHGPIEAMSTRFADALEVELRKLVERVEAAEGGVLRVTYEDSIAKAFFDAAHIAVFGPDLPATILGPFLRFDEAFPALAGLSNLPIPREISARLFAAKGDRAIKDLQRTLGRWIESGCYKSAPAGTQRPIDAMAEGGLSVADQAAGVIGLLLAVHSNSIRAIAWLFIYTIQSPTVLASLREEVVELRASSEPITAAGLPSRIPLLSSAFYEMLRLHSSVFGVRTAEQSLSLPTSNGSTFAVPQGDVLVIANMASHYNAELFPDPATFKAQRFVRDDGSFTTPKHILPFGGGTGMCKGKTFAVFNELWTVVRALELFDLRFVSLEKTEGRKMVDGAGATITVPGEVPGRAGAAVGTPDDGFVLELRLRRP